MKTWDYRIVSSNEISHPFRSRAITLIEVKYMIIFINYPSSGWWYSALYFFTHRFLCAALPENWPNTFQAVCWVLICQKIKVYPILSIISRCESVWRNLMHESQYANCWDVPRCLLNGTSSVKFALISVKRQTKITSVLPACKAKRPNLSLYLSIISSLGHNFVCHPLSCNACNEENGEKSKIRRKVVRMHQKLNSNRLHAVYVYVVGWKNLI